MRWLRKGGEAGYKDSTSGYEESSQSGAAGEGLVEEECSHESIEDEAGGL